MRRRDWECTCKSLGFGKKIRRECESEMWGEIWVGLFRGTRNGIGASIVMLCYVIVKNPLKRRRVETREIAMSIEGVWV